MVCHESETMMIPWLHFIETKANNSGVLSIKYSLTASPAVYKHWKCTPLHLSFHRFQRFPFTNNSTSMSWNVVVHGDKIRLVLLMWGRRDWNNVIQVGKACHCAIHKVYGSSVLTNHACSHCNTTTKCSTSDKWLVDIALLDFSNSSGGHHFCIVRSTEVH